MSFPVAAELLRLPSHESLPEPFSVMHPGSVLVDRGSYRRVLREHRVDICRLVGEGAWLLACDFADWAGEASFSWRAVWSHRGTGMANVTGTCRRTVQRRSQRLVDAGFLGYVDGSGGCGGAPSVPRVYFLTLPAELASGSLEVDGHTLRLQLCRKEELAGERDRRLPWHTRRAVEWLASALLEEERRSLAQHQEVRQSSPPNLKVRVIGDVTQSGRTSRVPSGGPNLSDGTHTQKRRPAEPVSIEESIGALVRSEADKEERQHRRSQRGAPARAPRGFHRLPAKGTPPTPEELGAWRASLRRLKDQGHPEAGWVATQVECSERGYFPYPNQAKRLNELAERSRGPQARDARSPMPRALEEVLGSVPRWETAISSAYGRAPDKVAWLEAELPKYARFALSDNPNVDFISARFAALAEMSSS